MTAPWPDDSATVVKWVRDALQQMSTDGDVAIHGLDRVKVTADLVGTDLNHLTLDATGVKMRFDVNDKGAPAASAKDGTEADPEMPEPALRETGVAKEFRIVARPMRVQRTPLTLDLRMHDVPIVWLTFAEPTVAGAPATIHALMPDEDDKSMRGTFHADIQTNDIAPLIASIARPLLKEGGVHLGRTHVDIAQDGPDGIRIRASAGLRWKLLWASARAEAHIEYTPDAVITIRDLTVGSRNLLVKFALLFTRKYIKTAIGQSIDLNARLAEDGASTRIHDVRVTAGHRLTLAARFS